MSQIGTISFRVERSWCLSNPVIDIQDKDYTAPPYVQHTQAHCSLYAYLMSYSVFCLCPLSSPLSCCPSNPSCLLWGFQWWLQKAKFEVSCGCVCILLCLSLTTSSMRETKKQNNKQTKKDLAAASLYLLLQYALFLLLFASLPNCYTIVKGQEVFLFFFPFVFFLRFCLTVSSNISFASQICCLLVLFLVQKRTALHYALFICHYGHKHGSAWD